MGTNSSPEFPYPGGTPGAEAPDPQLNKPGHFAWSRWIKQFVKNLNTNLMAHEDATTSVHGIADTSALVVAVRDVVLASAALIADVTAAGSGATPAGYALIADGGGGTQWAEVVGTGGTADSVAWDDVTGKPATFPATAHTHPASQISDSTATGRSVVTAANAAAARTAIGAGTSNFNGQYNSLTGTPTLGTAATRNVGTGAGTVAAGDDARLSDSRTPTAHTHPASQISDSTATGRSVVTAADAAAARSAIGAMATGPISYDALPAGSVLTVMESAGAYTRPTARADLCVIFTGASDPGSVAVDGDKWDQTA